MRKFLTIIALMLLPFLSNAEGWLGMTVTSALKDIKTSIIVSDYSYGTNSTNESYLQIKGSSYNVWLFYRSGIVYYTVLQPNTTAFKDAMIEVLDEGFTNAGWRHWKNDDNDIEYKYNSGLSDYAFHFKARY